MNVIFFGHRFRGSGGSSPRRAGPAILVLLCILTIDATPCAGGAAEGEVPDTQTGEIPLPGFGQRLEAISDDFEDDNWSFDFAAAGGRGRSANGLWTGSKRGVPEMLRRVIPSPGGLEKSDHALLVQSRDNGDDANPMQEDLRTPRYGGRLEKYPSRADRPSLIGRIYLPSIETVQVNWARIGLRLDARSSDNFFYPSLWVTMIAQPGEEQGGDTAQPPWARSMAGEVPLEPGYRLAVRLGDGPARDHDLGPLDGPGWYTLGIAFDARGVGHYFVKKGVQAFAPADRVWTTSDFPRGTDPRMNRITFHFISVGGEPGPEPTPAFELDDIEVFVRGE
jgi:hypothetical protein